MRSVDELDALIIAVPHEQLKSDFPIHTIQSVMKDDAKLIFDLKGMHDKEQLRARGYTVWHF